MQFSLYPFFFVALAIIATMHPVDAIHMSTTNSHARRSLTGKPEKRQSGDGNGQLGEYS